MELSSPSPPGATACASTMSGTTRSKRATAPGKDHDVVRDESQHEQDRRNHGHLDRRLGTLLAQARANAHYDPPPKAPTSVATSTVSGMEPPPGSGISAMVNTAPLIVRSTWYCKASQSAFGSVTPKGIFRRVS